MQVKTKVKLRSTLGVIPESTILNMHPICTNDCFEVADGEFKGVQIYYEHLEVVAEKTYTEKQWNELNDRLVTAGKLIVNLQEQNRLKDKEIEKLNFFLECSRLGFELALKAFKESEKAK